jgi:hypothetical protein
MAKYRYTHPAGDHIQGLPAADLDDATLTPEQLDKLKLALALGLYAAVPDESPVPEDAPPVEPIAAVIDDTRAEQAVTPSAPPETVPHESLPGHPE